MKKLEEAKSQIIALGRCKAAHTIAQASASACSQQYGVSLLSVSVGLDSSNKALVAELANITDQSDFNNQAQDNMLIWLEDNHWLKTTPTAHHE